MHIPVLLDQVLEHLALKAGHIVVDGTAGAAGHSIEIAKIIGPTGKLIAFDRDETAVELAKKALADMPWATVHHARFSEIKTVLAELGESQVDGILLDLGVSSMHLDQPDRGFSFQRPGPIDMRMDQTSGETALETIKDTNVEALALLLRDYGEERYAKRIAGRLKEAVRGEEIRTTSDLAALVSDCIPQKSKRQMRIHPATRVFQALRIAVNNEIGELEFFLRDFADCLRPGGRCAIISFHSLEDRPVKQAFRNLAWSSSLPYDLAIAQGERPLPICEVITKRPLIADDAEIVKNPRSRSAKLRVCKKLECAG